ncbi:lipopolysaccharide biosynthesis protein [Kineococcus glutinatus]|uniref:O-antigen/teichoic acid export membrane protein n=1 Tax=Kineococcus glutinatus TaxID=1070872 RepID=A0ABP9HFU3_9ACTN
MSGSGRRRVPVLAVAAGLSVVGVLLAGLTRTGYNLLVSNLRGEEVLGVLGPQIALAVLASMLWPAAAGAAASKFTARALGARDAAQVAALARHLRRRTLATGAVSAVLVGAWAGLRRGDGVGPALAVAALAMAYAGYLLSRGTLLGHGRVARATAWEGVALVLALGCLLVLLLTGAALPLLLPLALGYAAYAVAGWPRARGAGPLPPGLRREVDAFVAWGVLGNVASAGLLQLCLVVAGEAVPAREAGLLAAAVTLATPASMLARSLVQVLFPAMARSAGAGDAAAVRRQADRVTRGAVAVFVPLFAVLVLGARPLLRLAGEDFAGGVPALRVLLVAVLLTTLPVAAVAALTSGAARGIRSSALMSTAGFAVGVGALAVLAGPFGVTGIAVAYLLGAAVTSALPWVVVWRAQGQRWAGPTLRVVAAVAALVALVVVQEEAAATAWWAPVVSSAVFCAGWVLLSWGDVRGVLGSRGPGAAGGADTLAP